MADQFYKGLKLINNDPELFLITIQDYYVGICKILGRILKENIV